MSLTQNPAKNLACHDGVANAEHEHHKDAFITRALTAGDLDELALARAQRAHVARLLLEIYRGALAVYPMGAIGVGIACLNYADREWLLAAFNDFMPILP